MVYILGKVLEHGIPGWGDRERIMMAHFVKDKVYDKQDICQPFRLSRIFSIRWGLVEA
jgi:hypothetical protein